jgi:hypothetical protein
MRKVRKPAAAMEPTDGFFRVIVHVDENRYQTFIEDIARTVGVTLLESELLPDHL